MATRMHEVYTLDLLTRYGVCVKYHSATSEVSVYLPYTEFEDENDLPKAVTVTVEARG